MYYPADIREVPAALPPPVAPASIFSEHPLSPKPLFLLLRSPKGLVRLVTKARGLRWLRVRRLVRVVLGQSIR